MVASAVGAVILIAALAAFDLQRQFSRNTEQLLGAQASAGLALTMMQKDLENAGYRFHGGSSDAGGYSYAVVVRPFDALGDQHYAAKERPCRNHHHPAHGRRRRRLSSGDGRLRGPHWVELQRPQSLGSQVQGVFGGGQHAHRRPSRRTHSTPRRLRPPGPPTARLVMFWTPGRHCLGRVTSYTSTSLNFATVTVSTRGPGLRQLHHAVVDILPVAADARRTHGHSATLSRVPKHGGIGTAGAIRALRANQQLRPLQLRRRDVVLGHAGDAPNGVRGRRRHADCLARSRWASGRRDRRTAGARRMAAVRVGSTSRASGMGHWRRAFTEPKSSSPPKARSPTFVSATAFPNCSIALPCQATTSRAP